MVGHEGVWKQQKKASGGKGNRELFVLTGWSAPGALVMLLLAGSWIQLSSPVSQKGGKLLGNEWSKLSKVQVGL